MYCSQAQTKMDQENAKMFAQYRKLKGRKERNDYLQALDIFFKTTYKAYIDGEGDRDAAMETFKAEAAVDNAETRRIFKSVDQVHAYT